MAGAVWLAYMLGFVGAATYFKWTYARDNGFLKWMLLGEVVPTAKAMVWPYFVVARATHSDRLAIAVPQPSRSVQNFFFSLDALARANSYHQVGEPPDLTDGVARLAQFHAAAAVASS